MNSPTPLLRARAPGKLMLLGEHAVLHGRLALVAAVDRWLTVALRPLAEPVLRLRSDLGELELPLAELSIRPPYTFMLAILTARRDSLPGGVELTVNSEFNATLGLGSSSAVCAATLAALDGWLGRPLDRGAIFAEGLAAIRAVQGRGSGADLAAAVHGGVLAYRATPYTVTPLCRTLPLVAAYSGAKESTPSVMHQVRRLGERFPDLVQGVYEQMERSSALAVTACQTADWPRLGELLNFQQGQMESLGLANLSLATLVHQLRGDSGIYGSKISGAGLGDCVIGLGTLHEPVRVPAAQVMAIAPHGVELD